MVSSDNDSTNNNPITCTSSILVATTTNSLKYITMYYNSKYKTWKQAFDEVNREILKREILNAIATAMVGYEVENLLPLDNEDKQLVWENYYTTLTCTNKI